jgi:hypothetical protein
VILPHVVVNIAQKGNVQLYRFLKIGNIAFAFTTGTNAWHIHISLGAI